LEAAADPAWQVRAAAVMQLRQFPSEESLAGLRRTLTDDNPEVRWAASFSLHQLER
jgi:HEAT repeat protein